jgi:glutamate N-acetyltransferase / amino-acid N-acetyltransferase
MREGMIKGVKGFKFSARPSGIKKSGKPDMALIYSEVPARCAGVFTTNQVVAAPVLVTSPRVHAGSCQAILVNSGNANACTGDQGMRDALQCGALAARALGISEDLVAVSSTGVIGQSLPMEKFERHVPQLASDLGAEGADAVAQAIMTTDAFSKMAWGREEVDGNEYTILGIAKGAGMIHPNMATMLAFVLTDAEVEPGFLKDALRLATDASFNSITVDGDTSTNDMALLLANGIAQNAEICGGTPAGDVFVATLKRVMLDLAKMIVRDGEGATKLVEIRVRGAADGDDARLAARTVATSSLVKTAFFGEDANWGRIIAAVGYSGARIDPNKVEILFEEVPVVREGISTGKELEEKASEILKRGEFTVTVDLHLGSGESSYYTSDLTYDYVKINAAYRT